MQLKAVTIILTSLALTACCAKAPDFEDTALKNNPNMDWNQWRGPQRNGSAPASPPLINELPEQGLKPAWVSDEIKSGFDGGWSSPIVADGKVYLFTHFRKKLSDKKPTSNFPWLPPDKRGHLSAEEYRQYEINRRNEDEANGKLYGFIERLYCLDLNTGKQLWTKDSNSLYTRFLHSGTVTVANGKVYVLGANRKARCYNANTGDIAWESQLKGEFRDEFMMSSFLIIGQHAVVFTGHLTAFDKDTGKVLWENKNLRGSHTSPVAWTHANKNYILVNTSGKTQCVNATDGKQNWEVDSRANSSTPVIAGDYLITYGGSRKSGIRAYKMTPTKATEAWIYQGLADKGSSPVVVDNHVYVQGERRLACLDLQTGKPKWTHMLIYRTPEYTSLLTADGKIFYACEGLLCFAAQTDEYQQLFEGKMNTSGLLATEATQRKILGLNEIAKTKGPKEADNLYTKQVTYQGPMRAASPAISRGFILIRRNNNIICYDLNAKSLAISQ